MSYFCVKREFIMCFDHVFCFFCFVKKSIIKPYFSLYFFLRKNLLCMLKRFSSFFSINFFFVKKESYNIIINKLFLFEVHASQVTTQLIITPFKVNLV